jgi:hypothetical protein
MRCARLLLMIAAVTVARCGSPASPTNTGLAGVVRRGPVTPVCALNLPCDAPFSATFAVRQGDRTVATFRSDTQGRFETRLSPGTYVVVPGSNAPIISPASQAKQVEVAPNGLTNVVLQFDTGIR